LKKSNGSWHALHVYSALHAVHPNRLVSDVFSEPHCGHFTDIATRTGPPARPAIAACPDGGAMPNFSSFALPSLDIQSVVHAGESTSFTSASSYPAS
jgi:hypothetical protein